LDPGILDSGGAFVVGDSLAGFRRNAVAAMVYNGGYLDVDETR
jgi:hypothetical protein